MWVTVWFVRRLRGEHGVAMVGVMDHECWRTVLSTVPVLFNYWAKPADCLEISQFLNNHIADVCHAHPKRFIGATAVRAVTRI